MKLALGLAFALAAITPSPARADVAIVDSGLTQTIDCTADPEVGISGSSNNLTLTGPCTKLAVSGSSNTLTVESVKNLAISGSMNTIDVIAVDKIAVVGANNKVTYKKPATAKRTKVAKVGHANSVKKVK